MKQRATIAELNRVFYELLDMPEYERQARLEQEHLHPEDVKCLYRMVRADGATEPGFLDESVLAHARALSVEEDVDICAEGLIGKVFGAYRLTRLLGQGGMATVFLGERVGADFDQLVAVKLLRRGLYSAVEQKLFRRERRLLAQLSHPNIARLIDGGVTEAGIPFLVMEYVDGLRIDQHVVNFKLTVRQRLELFVSVCHAVEAAHQALIVHRDIKPSNILVSGSGQVKLLDFGIAKLLIDDSASGSHYDTITGGLTPGYAAPEQTAGSPVTTATDVYALGVVLHELLTGLRPDPGNPARASTMIAKSAEQEAPRPGLPSATILRQSLRGDLDNIIGRAISAEPERRYPTATAFAEDVANYLAGRPVRAHPPTRRYLFAKFFQRHRIAVIVSMLLSLTVLGSLGIALWQAESARQQAYRANTVRDFLISLFETAETDVPRELRSSPEDLIGRGGDAILGNAKLAAETRAEILGVLARVALSIGSMEQADRLTAAWLALTDQLYPESDERWIAARQMRAELLQMQARNADAQALLEPLRADLLERGGAVRIQALLTLAAALDRAPGRADDALGLQREIRDRAMMDAQSDPETALAALIAEANHLEVRHQFAQALLRANAAESFWKESGLPVSRKILWLYESIGNAASSLGDHKRGEAAYRDAINLAERLYARPHPDVAWFVGILGSYLVSLGRLEEAEPYVQRGLEMRRALLGIDHPDTLFAIAAAARLAIMQNRPDQAIELLDSGVASCIRTAQKSSACARLWQTRGRLHTKLGNFDRASADLESSVGMQQLLSGNDGAMVGSSLVYLSELQRRQKQYEKAIETSSRALSLLADAGGGHFGDVAVARLQRAWSRLETGQNQQAFDEIVEVEREFSTKTPENKKTRVAMLAVLARAQAALGKTLDAHASAASALALVDAGMEIDPEVLAWLQEIAAIGPHQ